MNNQAIDDMTDILMWLFLAPRRMFKRVNEQLDSINAIQKELDTLDDFSRHAAYINFPIDYTINQLFEQVLTEKSPIELDFIYACADSNRISEKEREITVGIADLVNGNKNVNFTDFIELIKEIDDEKANAFAERLEYDIDNGNPISMKTFIDVYDIGGDNLTEEQLKTIQRNEGKSFLEWSKDDAQILGIVDFALTNESPLRQYNKSTANDILNRHSQDIKKAKFGTVYNAFANDTYDLKTLGEADIFKSKLDTLEEKKFFTQGSGFATTQNTEFEMKNTMDNLKKDNMQILDDFLDDKNNKNNILELETDNIYIEIRKYQGQQGENIGDCLKVDICEKGKYNKFLVENIDTSFSDIKDKISLGDIKENLLERIGEASVAVSVAYNITTSDIVGAKEKIKDIEENDVIKATVSEKMNSFQDKIGQRDIELDNFLDTLNISDDTKKFSPTVEKIEFCKNIENKSQSEILNALEQNITTFNEVEKNIVPNLALDYFDAKVTEFNNDYNQNKNIYDEIYKMNPEDITKSTLDNNIIKFAFEDINLNSTNNGLDNNNKLSGIEAKTYILGTAYEVNPSLVIKQLEQYNGYQISHQTNKEINLGEQDLYNLSRDVKHISEKANEATINLLNKKENNNAIKNEQNIGDNEIEM